MAVEVHTRQFMGFQGNMLEACQKFGSLEEEHLAQMITFVMKMSEVSVPPPPSPASPAPFRYCHMQITTSTQSPYYVKVISGL